MTTFDQDILLEIRDVLDACLAELRALRAASERQPLVAVQPVAGAVPFLEPRLETIWPTPAAPQPFGNMGRV